MRDIVVLAGGDAPAATRVAAWREALRAAPPDRVVAADGGLRLAEPLRLSVDLLVGDLDSVTADDLAAARDRGVRVEVHPAEKDATDLALALDAALADDAGRITVVGGGGGRADHELAVGLLLASPRYAEVRVRWWSPRAVTDVVHPGRTTTLDGTPGELCSLLPVHGDAAGVHTTGLRYPLTGEPLPSGTSRGVSNQLLVAHPTVALEAGVLLVVRPGRPGPAIDDDHPTPAGPPATRSAPPSRTPEDP